MGKGKEVSLGSSLQEPTEMHSASKKNRTCTIIKIVIPAVAIGVILFLVSSGDPDDGKCNLFKGQWVSDPAGPSYNYTGCHFIDDLDNCLKNGRPDTQYLYWRWKPLHCDLPLFDPVMFMDAMRDKSWALIGDSILRNQMQSLICLVSKVEEPIETYHDKAFKSRTVYFPNHNLTIATIFAPFLAKSVINKLDDGKQEIELYLDILESSWTSEYHKYDYIVISGGQWFLKSIVMWEKDRVIGCHNCGKKDVKEIGFYDAYHKVLRMALNFIMTSDHKSLVIFRTWTPDHFEYGEWYNGGVCNRTQPYKEGQFNGKPTDHMMRNIELEEYERAKGVASRKGIQFELLDTFHLSLLRPDGHPGAYRTFHPFDKNKSAVVQNDCLHWCLPGPVDIWNELMLKTLSDAGALNSSGYQQMIRDLELVSSL